MVKSRIERHFLNHIYDHNRLIVLLAQHAGVEDGHFWEIETDIRLRFTPYPPNEELNLDLWRDFTDFHGYDQPPEEAPETFFGTAACRLSYAFSFVTGMDNAPQPSVPSLSDQVRNYEELVQSVIDAAGGYYRSGELEADPYAELCLAGDVILQHIQAMRDAPPQLLWNGNADTQGWPPR